MNYTKLSIDRVVHRWVIALSVGDACSGLLSRWPSMGMIIGLTLYQATVGGLSSICRFYNPVYGSYREFSSASGLCAFVLVRILR